MILNGGTEALIKTDAIHPRIKHLLRLKVLFLHFCLKIQHLKILMLAPKFEFTVIYHTLHLW